MCPLGEQNFSGRTSVLQKERYVHRVFKMSFLRPFVLLRWIILSQLVASGLAVSEEEDEQVCSSLESSIGGGCHSAEHGTGKSHCPRNEIVHLEELEEEEEASSWMNNEPV